MEDISISLVKIIVFDFIIKQSNGQARLALGYIPTLLLTA